MNGTKVLVATAAAVLTVNALVVVDALTFGLLVPRAEAKGVIGERTRPSAPATVRAEAGSGEAEAEAAYRALVAELQQQKQVLDRRADELAERERRLQALEQSLDAKAVAAPRAGFDRLLKAYEGMDPENAAAALAEVYRKDRQVVVEVLLGMKPRQAAAVLDSIAAAAPSIAAELSLEVWKRDR